MKACWKGKSEYTAEVHGFHSPEHLATYNEMSGTCLLPAGHVGDHEFTDDDKITIDARYDYLRARMKEML